MPIYSKESLETLRQRIDLSEVLSSHIELKRSGSSFKALCPFHEEKTPSFLVQRGDTHYHCFGCGAHGDAISFLMTHVKMGFMEAVESLAERFQVTLEKIDDPHQKKGPSKAKLKEALELTAQLYHYLLLYSEEGQLALRYLYQRGLDLDFIRQFEVGYAPRHKSLLISYLQAHGMDGETIQQAGLARPEGRDFFNDRITFPIRDALGAVIGFSARKFKEETFGGKYINTPETPLFKKSQVLFGLSYCRQRIAKEQKAIIVEGQIDALQLIHAGFNYTVAGQGTAFGQEHVKELIQLGVHRVYLALDGDTAGEQAAVKIGDLFQKKGVEALIVPLSSGTDPDTLLKEWGPSHFGKLLEESIDYLTFLFRYFAKGHDLTSPSQKNEVVEKIAEQVRQWEQPVMVHESLRKLAEIAQVPESALGVGQISLPDLFIKKRGTLSFHKIDPNRILEADLLRWLIFLGKQQPRLIALARANIRAEHFRIQGALRLFQTYIEAYDRQGSCDLLTLGDCLNGTDEEDLLTEIMQRKINLQKGEEGLKETLRKILVREWMEKREEIRNKIHSGNLSDEEISELAKQFDAIKKQIPELVLTVTPL
jgi:DNA primase